MYSKQEASKLKQEFWTRFGQYMKPVLSASEEKINWSNYRTGIPHLFFKMSAENDRAMIGIELSHPSDVVRSDQYEQFESIKTLMRSKFQEEWTWEKNAVNENGKPVSRIYTELKPVSVFRETDWPAIISFLKPRIMLLDEIWFEVKVMFE